jgi:chromate transporter
MHDRSREVVPLFLRLGFTAFGGPAVHIAMMRDETVHRRHWLSDQEFLDLLGIANLIPGPSSTEMAIYLGYRRAGVAGLIAAGAAFILPAAAIVLALAWGYVTYGKVPAVGRLFYGILPVLIAIIAQALWGLTRAAIKDVMLALAAAGALAFTLAGVNAVALLLGGGVAVMVVRAALFRPRASHVAALLSVPPAMRAGPSRALWLTALAAAPAPPVAVVGLLPLFWAFFKIGATVFGSGYVLLAYLHQDLVVHLHWLTNRQILDAIAIGQFTPGPVFTTATFIGYVLGGLPGAALATVGIFLPSFIFAAATYPFIAALRRSRWTSAFLDGVNAIAVALMAGVTWHLAQAAIVDWLTLTLAALAFVALARTKINSAILILAGGLVGIAAGAVGR